MFALRCGICYNWGVMKSTAKLRSGSTVTRGQKIALGLGDLGYGIVNNTMNSFILFFGNTVMGVPGTLMGLAVACGTMWDAVTDPLLGYASDNLRSRVFGRRHGFILLGVLLMSVLNVALWSLSPEWSSTAKFFWFVFFIVALETSYTFFATPNSALSLEITNDYNERSSIQIYKSVFTILGILIPTLLMGAFQAPTEAYPDGRFNPDSYRNFSYVGSALALIFGTIMFVSTFSHVPRLKALAAVEPRKKGGLNILKNIFKNFFITLKDRNFRSVILGYAVSMMAATILIAVGFDVFTFTFKTSTMQMYIIMAGLFLMTIVGQPLWFYISKKYDKKRAVLVGQSVSLVGCFMLLAMFLMRDFFNGLLEQNFFYVIFMMPPLMVAGLGTGVLYSLPLALIGDAIIIEKSITGEDRTATFAGFMTLAYKASQAVSQLILGSALDLMGFQEGSSVQTPAVEASLGWLLCLGVIASVGGGILLFSRYRIKRADVQEALEKINRVVIVSSDAESSEGEKRGDA